MRTLFVLTLNEKAINMVTGVANLNTDGVKGEE
jgi:hypothetical protein